MTPNHALQPTVASGLCPLAPAAERERSGDASRHPNGPAAVARGSGREARPEPAATPDSRYTTSGCSAPAGEPRGHWALFSRDDILIVIFGS